MTPARVPSYGSFEKDGVARLGLRYGAQVLDLAAALEPDLAERVAGPNLDRLLAAGPAVWAEVGAAVAALDPPAEHLHDLVEVRLLLPFTVADYVDFYSSEHHAANVGRIFRPDQDPLLPNWKHLPVGYHGRAGTVVVSGTEIRRPQGQLRRGAFGPTEKLDIEAEVGFVVGAPSDPGAPVALGEVADHVFGVCLLNDWSARDLQAWENRPLGPFLAKSFATSVSAWVTPLSALEAAWVPPPPRDPRPLPYLDDADSPPYGLDLRLEVRLDGHLLAAPPFAAMYWTCAQQLAHLTSNGAPLRTGDLYASGTVSGPERDQRGCLLELTWDGAEPVTLPDGRVRTYLEDGDEVLITATAPAPGGGMLELGEVRGRVAGVRDTVATVRR